MNKFFFILVFLGCALSAKSQQRFIVFANGYKGIEKDSVTTKNHFTREPDCYWLNYDDSITAHFPGAIPIYIDGHHPLSTSTHRTKGRVYGSYLRTRFGFWRCQECKSLNDESNSEGFQLRYDNGKKCGLLFLDSLRVNDPMGLIKDTLDAVCHSMGYAYALGFIEAVQSDVVLGKILILAPESPGERGLDWNQWQEVWQVGSNRFEEKPDRLWAQDGIAPQRAVKGIELLSPGKGGRVFVPKKAPHGFIRSHHLNWYQWYLKIRKGEPGYFSR